MCEEATVNAATSANHTLRTPDDVPINIDHYASGHSRVIVLAHGFYNSKEALLFRKMSEQLTADFDVIAMDFRGHGRSGGRFSFSAREHQDLIAVLEFARQHPYKKIGVIGFSLGAAASIIAASESDLIDSMIAVSAPTRFKEIEFNIFRMGKKGFEENVLYTLFGEGRLGKGVRLGNPFLKKIAPIEVIGNLDIPIFFLAGAQDWIIYARHTQTLYEKREGRKKIYVFEEGTHAEYIYRRYPEETIRLFKEWFSKMLQ